MRPAARDSLLWLAAMLAPVLGHVFNRDSVMVPAHCDAEVGSALRQLVMRRTITAGMARNALLAYLALPVQRVSLPDLALRALDLQANFSFGDALYLALAERESLTLVTFDERLRRGSIQHLSGVPVVSPA